MQIFDKFVPFSSAARLLLCEPLLVAPPEEGAREQDSDYKTAVCNGFSLKKERWDLHNARWMCRLCRYRGAHLDWKIWGAMALPLDHPMTVQGSQRCFWLGGERGNKKGAYM